jgi:hypothetical protein
VQTTELPEEDTVPPSTFKKAKVSDTINTLENSVEMLEKKECEYGR